MGVINDTVHFRGLSCDTFTAPAGSIPDASIATNAGIDDAKLKHRYHVSLSQTGTVVADTKYLKIVGAVGSVLAIEATITETIATGADRTVTIDLQKSTGAGAFATILSAAIVLNNASTLRVVSAGTITSPTLADNDLLRVTVAVAGAAGAQALGLLVSVTLKESAV